ncbi:hypothetical protein BDZ89DRAFT_1117527 [Hymenopellis radicata]|nr:hypothetical protein BDZ89DRAFT_1117527 [Hymenopellis radicata]
MGDTDSDIETPLDLNLNKMILVLSYLRRTKTNVSRLGAQGLNTGIPDSKVEEDAYRGGADGRTYAGDRAPDAPFLLAHGDGQETSVFGTVFKPNLHAVLVFSPMLEASLTAPHKYQDLVDVGVGALVDSKGYTYKHYDV